MSAYTTPLDYWNTPQSARRNRVHTHLDTRTEDEDPDDNEHWFGCRATEPGFAGDIGAIEVWLIDLLIDWLMMMTTTTTTTTMMIMVMVMVMITTMTTLPQITAQRTDETIDHSG